MDVEYTYKTIVDYEPGNGHEPTFIEKFGPDKIAISACGAILGPKFY